MDYEKKYKEALERARYWANNPTVWSSDDICQKLFPEIIEKKNERIKFCIGMCLTDADNQRFEDYETSLKDCLTWLEKQGEQKPAWSDEDEKQLERAIYMMEQLNMTKSWDDVYNWLKSLKPQPNWKPTEEQMEALDKVYKTHGADCECRHIILGLLNELKKL